MSNSRIAKMRVAKVYLLYLAKAEKKGRTKAEIDEIITWLTGYDEADLQQVLADNTDFETFFTQVPQLNPNVNKITGMICGYRVETIQDSLMQQIRYLDKLVDELAQGKPMNEILRQ